MWNEQRTVHMLGKWDAPIEDSFDVYEENSDESSKQTKESR